MKYRTLLTIAALSASMFTGCSKRPAPAPLTPSASLVIEPGVSIGPVHSGMTMEQVVAALGEPEQEKNSALEYVNLGILVVPGKDRHVQMVLCVDSSKGEPFTNSFAGHTKEGIGIGSSRADVVRAYGQPTATQSMGGNSGLEELIYKSQGLMIEIKAGKVYSIAVIFKTTP